MKSTPSTLLQQGLSSLRLAIPHEAQNKMLGYLELLAKWNRSYNLTAIKDPLEMVTHHLLDSLSLMPYLQGPRLLDVGTGAGFPGLPLALCCPSYEFVLLDSNGKKLRFIAQALSELDIVNVNLVQNRAESFDDGSRFNDIMARAVSSLSALMEISEHLIAPGGQWLVMKGIYPVDELNEIQRAYQVKQLKVPGLAAERHLVIIKESERG